MPDYDVTLEDLYEQNEEILENQRLSLLNQDEIIEKLDNLSRFGSDYGIEVDGE